MKYLVPEYYKQFRCKCGDCRHSCCDGWPIRISMNEYYRLVGIDCSDKLRSKLDCALKLCHETNKECYAQISTDWRGNCSLHREDGLCALQAELGVNSLPEVCRLYPRTTKRLTEISHSCCSSSCEEVVKLLINIKEPVSFEEIELSVVPEFEVKLLPQEYENCKKAIKIMQDRSLSLPERFTLLGNFLYGSDSFSTKPDKLLFALQILNVFDKFFESSISVSEYSKASQSYFCTEGKVKLSSKNMDTIIEKYNAASEHLEAILPDWQIVLEQLIVNHMFYNNFPYTENMENIKDAFLSLTAMYSFLRFNILGYMSDKNDGDELIDMIAAMFRLIEHSDFKYIAVQLLKAEKLLLNESVPQLIYF